MALRSIFEQPLFVNIKNAFTPKPEFLERSVPSAEPTGFRQFVERGLPALSVAAETATQFPGRPIQEGLERRGISPALALGAGFAADIVTPLPGGELRQVPKLFKGLKNLSTKLLESFRGLPEKVKPGRVEEVINKAKKTGIREADEQIVRSSVVKDDQGMVDLPKTAAKVEEQLVPLTPTPVKSPRWSSVGEDFIGDGKYGEIVYQSPIKTSAGDVHFPPRFEREVDEVGRAIPIDISYATRDTFPNYFSHIRYEDLADGKTRKILETQSDLFQKEAFEREIPRTQAEFETQKKRFGFSKIDEELRLKEIAREKEIVKLQPYSSNDPLAHLRTFREEVKRAAKDRKDTLLVPSGETAMKIEGLGDINIFNEISSRASPTGRSVPVAGAKLTSESLLVGKEIMRPGGIPGQNNWIITDILGDGKFKAAPKERLEALARETKETIEKFLKRKGLITFDETFDISGKVDTKHFVYKLNEEAIPREARKMGLEIEGKIERDNGEWWKIRIPHERARFPVEAFGAVPFLFPQTQELRERQNQPLFIQR